MIGVLVTTYGELPSALSHTVEAILGKQDAFENVAVRPDECQTDIVGHLQDAVDRLLLDCEGVLVLAGVYGESNCSLCQSLFTERRVRIVTGVNVPMLFKVFTYRGSLGLEELAQIACDGGQAGIRIVKPATA